eukprot:TRINITY_DN2009_c0_g1_i1.p1 TRINITY_DN2009_c0_g1~~TRINITY_DN2009_c0_g1_i1.p1  ORF type:complete len:215 (+),score=19.10 TRINITY_DN2009_c0_g1_i1:180-824(+)
MKGVIGCILFLCVVGQVYSFGQRIISDGSYGECSYVQYVNWTFCSNVRFNGPASCALVTAIPQNASENPCNYRQFISICLPGAYNVSTVDMSDYAEDAEAPYVDCLNDGTRNKECCTWNIPSCYPTCGGPDAVGEGVGTWGGYILPTSEQKYCFTSCTSCIGLQKSRSWCQANCGNDANSTIYCEDYTGSCCNIDNASGSTLFSWLAILSHLLF